jgi:3-isopropylmalate/(R)-2-methylmalate dehydratase small subunit
MSNTISTPAFVVRDNIDNYLLKPLGEVRPVIDTGGLFTYVRRSGMMACR